jgi:hypothetical protein
VVTDRRTEEERVPIRLSSDRRSYVHWLMDSVARATEVRGCRASLRIRTYTRRLRERERGVADVGRVCSRNGVMDRSRRSPAHGHG